MTAALLRCATSVVGCEGQRAMCVTEMIACVVVTACNRTGCVSRGGQRATQQELVLHGVVGWVGSGRAWCGLCEFCVDLPVTRQSRRRTWDLKCCWYSIRLMHFYMWALSPLGFDHWVLAMRRWPCRSGEMVVLPPLCKAFCLSARQGTDVPLLRFCVC